MAWAYFLLFFSYHSHGRRGYHSERNTLIAAKQLPGFFEGGIRLAARVRYEIWVLGRRKGIGDDEVMFAFTSQLIFLRQVFSQSIVEIDHAVHC